MTSKAPSWVAVCRLDEIPTLGARRVARPPGVTGAQVALFRTADDGVHALLDRCPHKAGPLSQGIVSADAVACPLHNWTIGLADGRARAPDEGATPVFRCRVVQGEVQLDADELRGHAVDAGADLPCSRACAPAAARA